MKLLGELSELLRRRVQRQEHETPVQQLKHHSPLSEDSHMGMAGRMALVPVVVTPVEQVGVEEVAVAVTVGLLEPVVGGRVVEGP